MKSVAHARQNLWYRYQRTHDLLALSERNLLASKQIVVPGAAIQRITAAPTMERVVAIASVQHVVARATDEQVVASELVFMCSAVGAQVDEVNGFTIGVGFFEPALTCIPERQKMFAMMK